jgi:hypothetical protein
MKNIIYVINHENNRFRKVNLLTNMWNKNIYIYLFIESFFICSVNLFYTNLLKI